MKYKVHARHWNKKFTARFGEQYSVHELTDSEVVESIMSYGRAEIVFTDSSESVLLSLEFQNDYD